MHLSLLESKKVMKIIYMKFNKKEKTKLIRDLI
jgi:hypothetical protein